MTDKGAIVKNVVGYVVREIVSTPDEVSVTIVEQGPDEIVAEVRTAQGDMGRVIGRRGRVRPRHSYRGPGCGGGRGPHGRGRVRRLNACPMTAF